MFYSLRRRETRSSGRTDQDGGDPPEALPAPIQQPCVERRLAFVLPVVSRTDHCRGGAVFRATLSAFAKRADSRHAGAGHHSHGTARLVRREGLQVFTPSSSAIPHDSCPVRARPGRPPAALRPLAARFTHPSEAPGDPTGIFIKQGHIPSKTGHVFMKTMSAE